jgi:hypothetical protein
VLVLCAADEDLLLPTVRSRCVRVRLSTVPADEIAAQLEDDGVDPHRASAIARMARGSVGRARALAAAPEAALLHDRILRELLDLVARDRAERLAAASGLMAAADQLETLLAGPEEGAVSGVTAGLAGSGGRGRGARGRAPGVDSVAAGTGDRAPGTDEAGTDEAGVPERQSPAPRADEAGVQERQSPAVRRRAVLGIGEAWREIARDLAVASRGGGSELRHIELLEDLRVAALGIEPGSAERFLARLGDILPAVEQNANPELALDVLLLDWPRSRRAA